MSKARFSPANPGPAAVSLGKYLTETHGVEVDAKTAQAFLSYHSVWQRARNSVRDENGLTEVDRERLASKAKNQADEIAKAAKNADKIAEQYKGLCELWLAAEAAHNESQPETPKRGRQSA